MLEPLETPNQNAPSRACAPERKLAPGFLARRHENRTRKPSRKSLHSRLVARPTATKTASGVRYYGYRYYNTGLGRWVNRDPIGENGGMNLYGMVGSNPVSGIDSLGLYEAWGEEFTERHEGFSEKVYVDSKGKRTIGIGFNIDDPTIRAALSSRGYNVTDLLNGVSGVTRKDSRQIMKTFLVTAETEVIGKYLGAKCAATISSDGITVLTAMTYQMGISRMRGFKKLKDCLCSCNQPDYACAAKEMLDSDWARTDSPGRAQELSHIMNMSASAP